MTINIKFDDVYKAFVLGLLVVISGLLLWGQPWNSSSSNAEVRKIQVTGEATLAAEPNEYQFNPYFQDSGADRDKLRDDLVNQASEIVEDLKGLGVEEKDIKVDASSYDNWYWQEDEEGTMTVSVQIKIVDDKDLVQEVQNYLINTDAKGQLTPYSTFSEDKRKELDNQAYEQAAEDARTKAEARAKLFDAKLGDVLKIDQAYDSIFQPYGIGLNAVAEDSVASNRGSDVSLPVLQGENEYTQSVTVEYEIK